MGTVPDFDVPELIRYGKEKGVGIILWASWLTLRDQFDEAMDRFQQLGAVGIKPDFFSQRRPRGGSVLLEDCQGSGRKRTFSRFSWLKQARRTKTYLP
ncbi:MAG: glycoside hydrolase family 97 catalytic domain-containing protein [Pseudomonadota bacterium]|nr:glycoside hydrolase family 97 catalytic domain-containing protein [Pseudomonadota bacterium]